MKNKIFYGVLLIVIVFFSKNVDAAPANPEIVSFEQPTGETFKAQTKGDERFNYVITESGMVIEQSENGFWYYLQKNNERNNVSSVIMSKAKVAIDKVPNNTVDEKELQYLATEEQEFTVENKETVIKPRSIQKGNHTVLVLLVEFEDIKLTYSDEDWKKIFFEDTAPSLKEYYLRETDDLIGIEPAKETDGVADDGIIRVSLDGKHPNTGANTTIENKKITRSALEKADQYIDYSQYDRNKNNRIEPEELHFVVIVAGQEQSAGSVTEPAIWGHRWSLGTNKVTLDNTVLEYYAQFGEKHAARQATLGIIAHEVGHDLGLPDLYNVGLTDENGVTTKEGRGLGYTSLMASGSWGARPGEYMGTTPVGLDAYSKLLLGMDVETITTSQLGKLVQTLNEGSPTILKVNSINDKEYFLIENRQLSGYDEGMTRNGAIYSGGIAIYRVNENYKKNYSTGKQLVTLLEADEGIRGFSYYGNGGLWNADPFYYLGTGIHGKKQNSILFKDTTPSTEISNGTLENFLVEVKSSNNSKMYINILINLTDELWVTKTTNKDTGKVGETLSYTVIGTNTGNKSTSDAKFSDVLPKEMSKPTNIVLTGGAALTLEEGEANANKWGEYYTWDEAAHVLEVYVGKGIPLNDKRTLTYDSKIISGNIGDKLNNVVTLNSSDIKGNSVAEAAVTVIGEPKISVKKTADKATVKIGETITYTLRGNNLSDATAAAKNIVFADVLPEALGRPTKIMRNWGTSIELKEGKENATNDTSAEYYMWEEKTNTLSIYSNSVGINRYLRYTYDAIVLTGKDGDKLKNVVTLSSSNTAEKPADEATVIVKTVDYLHVKQEVINKHTDLVLPITGSLKLSNVNTADNQVTNSIYTMIIPSYQVDTNKKFKSTKIQLTDKHDGYLLEERIPEFYEYVGYQITKAEQTHHSANLIKQPIPILDYRQQQEYWVTIYIQPTVTEVGPPPYDWGYKVSDFGMISYNQ